MVVVWRVGSRIFAVTSGTAPSEDGVLTAMWPSPWLLEAVTASCPDPAAGSVHDTTLAQKRLAVGSRSQSLVHRPAASLVQATDRPSPYCQAASTGSSFLLASTISAAGLGVVAT